MAGIEVSAVKVTINAVEYNATKSGTTWVVDNLDTALAGKLVTAVTVTASGGTSPYTASGYSSLAVPNSATITVTDSATPDAGTTTFTLDLNYKAGYTMENTINKAGWFNFRRIAITGTYASGGIALPVPVAEVIAVECKSAVNYEFDKANNKVKLYKAVGGTEVDAGDVTLSVLAWLV